MILLFVVIAYLLYSIFIIIIFVYSIKIEKIFDIKESDKYSNEIIQLLINAFSNNYYYSLSLIIVLSCIFFLMTIPLIRLFLSYCSCYKKLPDNLLS